IGSTSNTVTVTGTNSVWNNSGDLYVGYNGSSNTLTIANGGKVSDSNGYIDFIGHSSSNNTVTITGAGSVWTNSGNLTIGYSGAYNTLIVSNGGQVFNNTGYIGYYNGSTSNTVTVTDTNSVWNNSGDLYVGYSGSSNTLTIANGGKVSDVNGFIDAPVHVSSNNTVTVTGAGSIWTNSGSLAVGYSGVGNTLTITNGGQVYNTDAYIGYNTSASNNTVTVTGTGSTWNNSGALWVGRNGGNNQLNIFSGSTVKAGYLTVNNGTLHIDQQTTVTISGNYTQTVNGTLSLAIGGTATNQYGFLTVTGTASLTGTLQLVRANSYNPSLGDTQQIITAGTVTGTFGTTLTNGFATNLKPKLLYLTGLVDLTWVSATFAPYAQTPNQQGVGGAIDNASNNGLMVPLTTYLSGLSSDQLPAALDQLTPTALSSMRSVSTAGMDTRGFNFLNRAGELRAGSRGFSSSRLSLYDPSGPGASLQPVVVTADAAQIYAMRSDDPLKPTLDNPWGVYVEGQGEFVDVRGDANASGYHLSSGGFTLGLDRRIDETLAIGFTVGYNTMNGNLANGGTMGVDNEQVSLYTTWFRGGLHLEGMVGGGYNSYKTSRIVFGTPAVGTTDGTEFTGLIGGGYDLQKGLWSFGPQLALQYKRMDINAFDESGSLAPLHIDSQSQDSLQSRLGGRLGFHKVVGRGIIITPEFNVAWQHEYINRGISVDARFVNGAGDTFTSSGPAVGADSLVLGVGVSVQWTPTVGTFLNYSPEFGSGYTSQKINGGVGFRF
ncbi:MAG: autotransporter domain-containing protein, partial [Verrucomicrobiota bacterium]